MEKIHNDINLNVNLAEKPNEYKCINIIKVCGVNKICMVYSIDVDKYIVKYKLIDQIIF